MDNRYNFFYFEAEFKKYLIAGKAEVSTVKNYLSDLHYFFSWLQSAQHMSDLAHSELSDVFSHSLIYSYFNYLTASITAENTIIRRFASLRKFFDLCIDQRWIQSNPVDDFNKQTKKDEREGLLKAYKTSIESRNIEKSDIDRQINIIRDLITNFN